MDFRAVHVYAHAGVDAKAIASKIAKLFPRCRVDVRRQLRYDDVIERARIFDLKQPFEKQQKTSDETTQQYDGYVLQQIFAEIMRTKEADHIHIILTDLLTCTFSEDDWRFHGRTVVCGTPSIISTTGIVEAPAKPREFYLAQLGGIADVASLKKEFAGRFIDYDDPKITQAAAAYALQALFFFVADGEPFCSDGNCLLYNAHWQKELLHILEKDTLCTHHRKLANKFNKAKARR